MPTPRAARNAGDNFLHALDAGSRRGTYELAKDNVVSALSARAEDIALPLPDLRTTNDPSTSGANPILFLSDGARRFVFKPGIGEAHAAEVLTWNLRSLGGMPGIPARECEAQINGTMLRGLIRPFIEASSEEMLPKRSRNWSETQRNALLAEHPWCWLLQDFDTHERQYLLLGPEKLPVNVDAGAAFDVEKEKPSRHDRLGWYIAPLRNVLYRDYVRGSAGIREEVVLAEARKIEDLDDSVVEAHFRRFAMVKFSHPREIEAFVARAMDRKRNMVAIFREFLEDLATQREQNRGAPGVAPQSFGDWLSHTLLDTLSATAHDIGRSSIGFAISRARRWIRVNLDI